MSGFHVHAEPLEIGRGDYFFAQRKEFAFFCADMPLEDLPRALDLIGRGEGVKYALIP